eukprot:3518733-Alexandrium_andersonii.AAC.1
MPCTRPSLGKAAPSAGGHHTAWPAGRCVRLGGGARHHGAAQWGTRGEPPVSRRARIEGEGFHRGRRPKPAVGSARPAHARGRLSRCRER